MAFQRELFQYVFDACSLINIERDKKTSLLRQRKGSILIPEKVAFEVAFDPRIRSDTPLRHLLLRHPQMVTKFKNSEEVEYLRIRRQPGIGDGEAAAIAVAVKRQLPLVIDDIKGRQKAENHGVKTLSWRDFIGG